MAGDGEISIMSMRTLFDRARRVLFEASFYLVLIIGSTVTIFSLGPYLETRFWPTVSKLHILSIEATGPAETTIRAEFTKLRNCEYVGISWYRGTPQGGFERVPVILLRQAGDTSSPNRPTGKQRAGPWIIGVPISEVPSNSFAQLVHRCHPFWPTTTDFYP